MADLRETVLTGFRTDGKTPAGAGNGDISSLAEASLYPGHHQES